MIQEKSLSESRNTTGNYPLCWQAYRLNIEYRLQGIPQGRDTTKSYSQLNIVQPILLPLNIHPGWLEYKS